MKILFMGTPDFSVPCLKALYDAGHEICAVFTQADKPVGRKQILTPPPVKIAANELNIPVYQPKTLRDGTALEIINKYAPDMIVVVAYGKILPSDVLHSVKYGCVNVHGSLLPKFRGASPIQSAIIAGEKVTGITTMYMDEGLDTGDIILTEKVPILNTDNAESLFNKMSVVGAELLVKTVALIASGNVSPIKQNDADATFCTVLDRESGKLDFSCSAFRLFNLIRGLDPWPSAYFTADGKKFKVFSSKPLENCDIGAGKLKITKNELIIGCGNSTAISIVEIQPEGKKRMPVSAFLNGSSLTEDSKIEF